MEFLPKNGQVHSYAFSTSGLRITTQQDNDEANQKLNEVLVDLQNQNYEIVDVKMSTIVGAILQFSIRFLVLYK